MQILGVKTYNNETSFKAVKLSPSEISNARKIVEQSIQKSDEKFKVDLFKLFEKHLIAEAKEKTKDYHIKEDVLQELNLYFLEI